MGDFHIRDKIGTGTQGAVYRAHQISRGRPVALKVFSGDAAQRPQVAARFAREAAVLARLDHPGIVRCYGAGAEHGFRYFAMEYIDGWTAAALIQGAGGKLAPADALHIALRCAEALGYAAARHVIHRDVKPGNILLGRRGEVKLTDWGLAKPTDGDHALTGENTCMGTLRYVAPEQIRDARRADQRSDVYALGGVLYELLTGRVPFPESNWVDALRAKEDASFPLAGDVNPAVPRRCDAVLSRMLAPDPARRFPDYEQLSGALRAVGPVSDRLDLGSLIDRQEAGTRPLKECSRPLRVLLVYDEADYVPLVQHALHAAGVPHDLSAVEDGHLAGNSVARDRGASGPDVLVLGLTSPTQASLRMLTEVRGGPARDEVAVCGLSQSPDGAALLRTLGLGVSPWVTGFIDLKPLSEAFRSIHASASGATKPPS